MFFIWGYKEVVRKIGFVAEKCPSCHQVQFCEIKRTGLGIHVFYVALEKGKFVSATAECKNCKHSFYVDITKYKSFIKKIDNTSLDSVIASTNPDVWRPDYGEMDKAMEVFLEHEPPAFGYSSFDRYSILAFILTLSLPILLGMVLTGVPKSPQMELLVGKFLLFLFSGGLLASFVIFFRGPKRRFNREVLPHLIKDLSELNASKDEIDACMKRLKSKASAMNKLVKSDQLYKQVTNFLQN